MYGVLYQLLGTAYWAGKIQLNTPTDGNEWAEARLVIEPSGGGGDTQIESAKSHIVEQWKSKSDAGAWSLRKVISKVSPDLYRAVELPAGESETEFRFVTEGHRGRWNTAERFFRELHDRQVPDDPLAALDDVESIKFFPDGKRTKRGLFQYILRELRTHGDIAQHTEPECARKLWYLLGRFELHGDRTAEKLIRDVDAILLPLVEYREQVEPKRRELCAALLELAAAGHAELTPHEVLAKAGLNHRALCDWAGARAAVLKATGHYVQTRWRYSDQHDVRSAMCPPEDSFVCVLSGESGQGKTWRLASLSREAFRDASMAVAVSATGDAGRDLLNAANVVWRDGFQREGPTDLDLVARKRREFLPKLATPWLTVCIDDVQSIDEARSLVEQDWPAWGIRLAMTALPPVARALKETLDEEATRKASHAGTDYPQAA